MKVYLKKHLVLLSALMLAAGLLAACSGNSKDVSAPSKPSKPQEEPDVLEEDFYSEEDDYPDDYDLYAEDEYLEEDDNDRKEEDSEQTEKPEKPEKPEKSGKKISFVTTDLGGNDIKSEELFAKHEVTMVNVWATWCGPCVNELPEIDKLSRKLKDKDCAIVGLVGDGEDDYSIMEASEILEKAGADYLNILPWDGATEKDFVIEEGWPTTYFVDRDGYLIGEPIAGAHPDQYEATIEQLLGGR